MKHITSKIISFIGIICMVFAVNTFVFAADSEPEILIRTNKEKNYR